MSPKLFKSLKIKSAKIQNLKLTQNLQPNDFFTD